MCRVLGLSPSGYYAWKGRELSVRAQANEVLLTRVREIDQRSRDTYGRPRILAELRDEGLHVNHKRVGRLMALHGIVGATRRKKWRTTKRRKDVRPYPDLVERDFSACRPDRLWVADLTYVPTWSGFLFLAVVVDAFSRRCKEAGVRPSMGSAGDAYGNALCESFFATLECELVDRRSFRNRAEGKIAVFGYIEGWYNPYRRHSALDYDSPMRYEQKHQAAA